MGSNSQRLLGMRSSPSGSGSGSPGKTNPNANSSSINPEGNGGGGGGSYQNQESSKAAESLQFLTAAQVSQLELHFIALCFYSILYSSVMLNCYFLLLSS